MPASQSTKVFVIPGRFGHERLEDHEVESKAEAERLVGTGLFALSAKEANEQAFTSPATTEADESNVKQPHTEPAAPAPAAPEQEA